MDVISALARSRKAWVLLLCVMLVGVLAGTEKIESAQALDFLKWLVSAWFAAVAIEDGAAKVMLPPPNPPD